ncbi:hypothetical protein Lalb_Chr02g0155311 [Lupinus albus]|uniref:Uncharacterized protein n=1 Tax=Lupinus albus TaxID=3870 RepID=A0A6A4R1P1_LUPAL|nr:hypothetical protein Lalb_Chr02g0155311 [Lupinus albus]
MESTTLKSETLKPIILQAGVPLAISFAGFIYAWMVSKKTSPLLQNNESNSHETNSHQGTTHEEVSHMTLLPSIINEEPVTTFANSVFSKRALIYDNPNLEPYIISLRNRINELECCKSENRKLQKKVQKLLRRSTYQFRLIKDRCSALQTRVNAINKLEDENKELQRVLDQLQEDKNELLKKLHTTKTPYASKVEREDASNEDCNQLLDESEQVKKELADEVEEMIQLRESNKEQQNEDRDHIELEFEGNGSVKHYDSKHDSFLENQRPIFSSSYRERASSKKTMLLKRLKRWAEGSEKVTVKPYRNSH